MGRHLKHTVTYSLKPGMFGASGVFIPQDVLARDGEKAFVAGTPVYSQPPNNEQAENNMARAVGFVKKVEWTGEELIAIAEVEDVCMTLLSAGCRLMAGICVQIDKEKRVERLATVKHLACTPIDGGAAA